jgi:hypothetical protein
MFCALHGYDHIVTYNISSVYTLLCKVHLFIVKNNLIKKGIECFICKQLWHLWFIVCRVYVDLLWFDTVGFSKPHITVLWQMEWNYGKHKGKHHRCSSAVTHSSLFVDLLVHWPGKCSVFLHYLINLILGKL